MWWDHLLDWVQDDNVWEWIRTAVAALIGALLGGLFTLWGQSRSEKAQAARDKKAREQQQADARRATGMADLRALFASVIDLDREVRDMWRADLRLRGKEREASRRATIVAAWEAIWSDHRRSVLRSQINLVPDTATRANVLKILGLLTDAENLSRGSAWPDAQLQFGHTMIYLCDEAVEAVASDIRGDNYTPKRPERIAEITAASEAFRKWLGEAP